MKNTPIDYSVVKRHIDESGLGDLSVASIREIVKLITKIQNETGEQYIRMEMGVPGLMPPEIGIEAEIKALKDGWGSKYAPIEGIPPLKEEVSRFAKQYLDITVRPECCLATVGSMQGSYATFLIAGRISEEKDHILFIDPGFPVQKQQLGVIGIPFETFDVYDYRGEALREKLESYLAKGNISAIMYSNPNNPSWICFTDTELKIIAELADKYDAIVIEDLAYFAMDFRKDYSKPGQPPYQPTVAKYTENFMLLISSSKAFSYAGQRVGTIVISEKLYDKHYPGLKRFYKTDGFGYTLIYGALYPLSAGVAHSAQYGFAAMLKAANDGDYNFVDDVKEYGKRAETMKKLFVQNGFNIVYDMDEDKALADGFYFTVSYPNMTSSQLLEELVYYGISAISLTITGSKRTEGLRACVSQTDSEQFPVLEERLKAFYRDHPVD